ncbi:TPA: hypothetical protein MW168_003341, partial [Acinetobacter baumannii]|nr:hypothetical protein [Acinetobacter baumannii]
MKKIIINVNDAKQRIEEVQDLTLDGVPTILQAKNKVNYEFVDEVTGKAPKHIIAKRVENDLHISFEENGDVPDLIIQDFYLQEDSQLIGLGDDGNYHYYIADTHEKIDYATQLQVGQVEGQYLPDDKGFLLPWWIGAGIGTNLWPILGVAAGAALIFGGSSGGSSSSKPVKDTTAPTAPTVKDVHNTDNDGDGQPDSTTIIGKAEPGSTVGIDTNGDGKPDVTVVADGQGNYSLTVTPALEDGKDYPVTATDNAGNSSTPTNVTGDTTAPSAPVLTANPDGSVSVEVPADAKPDDSVTVNVTPEGGGTAVPVTLTKNLDGSWSSSDPTVVPAIPVAQTNSTIPADQLADGQPVTATAQDSSGNSSTATPVNAA